MYIPAAVKYCARAATQAPSADNTQPWRLIWDGERLTLCPRELQSGFPVYHPAVQIALGAAAENLLQAGASIGAEPTVLPQAGNADKVAEIRIPEPDAEVESEAALFARHTNRFPFRKDALPADVLAWIKNQNEGDAQIRVLDQPGEISALADLTRRASEVRFQTQEVHEWLAASFRLTPAEAARGDGLDIATLDLPPGGAWLLRFINDWRRMAQLNRLGAYKAFAQIEKKPIAQAPALLAVIGKSGAVGARAAGRLMQRVWIELNQRGIAVQPGFVIPEQILRLTQDRLAASHAPDIAQVARETSEILALQDQTFHMLLRIGMPKREVKRSLRLPLEQVLSIAPINSDTTQAKS